MSVMYIPLVDAVIPLVPAKKSEVKNGIYGKSLTPSLLGAFVKYQAWLWSRPFPAPRRLEKVRIRQRSNVSTSHCRAIALKTSYGLRNAQRGRNKQGRVSRQPLG
jgi:hypothetical protein